MESFKGEEFLPQEQQVHLKHLATITRAAQRFLEQRWADHVAFYERHRVSKYYGARSKALDTAEERIAELRKAGASPELASQLKPTSCIGLCFEALRTGFNAPVDPVLPATWENIERYTRDNRSDGSAVADALQKLGWRICYWNPSPKHNVRWDAEDASDSSKLSDGAHEQRYQQVIKQGRYYKNRVDDKTWLAGFGTKVPADFLKVPFFAGVAHAGYHVFPGFFGDIIEAHSMRPLASFNNLEKSAFNPLARGGGPRWTDNEKYRSGIIAVPPKV